MVLPGYGSAAQPRAGAFVAKADDPSAVHHNPAGLAKQRGTVVQIGFNLVSFSLFLLFNAIIPPLILRQYFCFTIKFEKICYQ